MAQSTRYAVVDDNDSSIRYSEGWVLEEGTQQQFSENGTPFRGTLHRISQNGSLSLDFHGSTINVWGFGQTTLEEQATWRCFIDGIEITPGNIPTIPTNNLYLCSDNGLLTHAMGLHTLTVNVTSTSPNASFWFDWLQYIPQPGYVFDASDDRPSGASMYVAATDDMIHFDDQWTPWATNSNITWVDPSEVTIDFIGTSLSWFGTFYQGNTGTTGLGSYSVDGLPDVMFSWSSQPTNFPRQLFFEVSNLSFDSHKTVVNYLGPASLNSAPLILDYLIIGNASLPQQTTSTKSIILGPSIPVSPTRATPSSGVRTTVIIGSVIGGSFALVLLIFLLLWKSQRKRPESWTVVPFLNYRVNGTRSLRRPAKADSYEALHLLQKGIPIQTPRNRSHDDNAEVHETLPAYTEISS